MTQSKLMQIVSGSVITASLAISGCSRIDAECKSTTSTIVRMLQSLNEEITRSDINIPVESVSKNTLTESQYACVIKEVDNQTHGKYNIQMIGYSDKSKMIAYHITTK